MALFPWCYPVGIFAAAFLPFLPAIPFLLAVAAVAVALAAVLRAARWRWLLWVLLGACHGALWGHWQQAHTLPPSLDKSDYQVVGVITSLPRIDNARVRFILRVEEVEGTESPPLRNLLLSWYGPPDGIGAEPALGERDFAAKIRRQRRDRSAEALRCQAGISRSGRPSGHPPAACEATARAFCRSFAQAGHKPRTPWRG